MRFAWLVAGAMIGTCVVAGSGCALEPPASRADENTGTAAQAIQNGTTDTTSKFAVGVCHGNANDCRGVCSGALILPNVVATARHCVDASDSLIDCAENPTFGPRKPGAFNVTTNTTMFGERNDRTGWYSVESIAVPDDDHVCGSDIALLVLSQSVPSTEAKPIVPGIQYLMWDPDQYLAAEIVGIGYGNTSPAGGDSGIRRISKSIDILCIPGSDDKPCPSFIDPKEFVAGDGTCSGDSGSSAFKSTSLDEGAPLSFGVLSRGGQSADGTKCRGSVYIRFDSHRDFVLSVARAASDDWTLYPEPFWTAYRPPPAPKEKDAGAKDSGKTKPPALGLGELCEYTDDCEDGLCVDPGDGSYVCSQACDESSDSSCPEGFECRQSLCLPPAAAPAAAPTTRTITRSTCAASAVGASSGAWASLALGATAVLGALRRRGRRQPNG